MQFKFVFLDIAKFTDFRWKMLMSAKLKECVTWFIYFVDLLQVRYNSAKFHHCRICVTDFREVGAFLAPPPIREQPRKSPSWIGFRDIKELFISFLMFLSHILTFERGQFWDFKMNIGNKFDLNKWTCHKLNFHFYFNV